MTAPLQHLISVDDLTREHLDAILGRASYYNKNLYISAFNDLPRKRLLAIFCEPSTRTRLSFEAAMLELGGTVMNSQDANVSSSFAKEESVEDGIRVMSAFCHTIVFRYNDTSREPEERIMVKAARASHVPLINGGDGPKEHPSQTLVDLFTIQHERGQIDGLTIALAGDLYYGRTIHSLMKALLQNYRNNRFILISPEQLALPPKYKDLLKKSGASFEEYRNFTDAPIGETDCLYVTRIQGERFDDQRELDGVRGCCVLRSSVVERMRKDAIILHPLPRVDELPSIIDDNERAKYFPQAAYGLPVRMALLCHLLKGW